MAVSDLGQAQLSSPLSDFEEVKAEEDGGARASALGLAPGFGTESGKCAGTEWRVVEACQKASGSADGG